MNKFFVCFNNAFRWLMSYSKCCSANTLFVHNEGKTCGELRRKIINSLVQRLIKSRNGVVMKLITSTVQACSVFHESWHKLLYNEWQMISCHFIFDRDIIILFLMFYVGLLCTHMDLKLEIKLSYLILSYILNLFHSEQNT